MATKSKNTRNTSTRRKQVGKAKKSWLKRSLAKFNPRSNPIGFVLIFAVVGVLGIIIANAATKNFSFSGRLTDKNNTKLFSVTADNTGNLTASLTWDRKTTINLKVTDSSGTTVVDNTSTTSPINVAIPVTKSTYTFKVSKVSGWNTSFKLTGTVNTVDPTDTIAPTAPTNLRASLTSSDTASLVWTASSDNVGVANYKVYRNGALLTTVSTTNYSNSGLAAGTTYDYTVTAYDAAGNPSHSSNTASVATAGGTTTPPTISTSKLKWAPPTGWQNYPVKTVSATTGTQSFDAGGGDLFIDMPSTPTGPITISNCRNVVMIGGQINIPPNSGPGTDMRGVYIKGCSGTVHVEGVYINGDISTAEGDGVAISAPNAIVQLQNLRIYKLYGGYDTSLHNHSDIVQPWGGVLELRIDRMTGSSNYQGYQINNDLGPIGRVEVNNVNIGDSGVPPPDGKGGYYLWPKCGAGTKYVFNNAYLQTRSGRSLSSSIWDGGCGLSVSNNVATFGSADVTGSLTGGQPASGDFVPAGVAGINYTTPGYQ